MKASSQRFRVQLRNGTWATFWVMDEPMGLWALQGRDAVGYDQLWQRNGCWLESSEPHPLDHYTHPVALND